MQINSLVISKLYGYLNFDVKFYPDFNFLIGINGSGKTSVLNAIAWLTTPLLTRLAQVDFERIEVGYGTDDTESGRVVATKSARSMQLSIDGISHKLEIPIFEYPSGAPLADRPTLSISEMYDRFRMEHKNDVVLMALEALGPPLYLPLNRRWETPEREVASMPRAWLRSRAAPRPGGAMGPVLYLAERYYRERQTEVGLLNEKLREDLVEYTFGDIVSARRMQTRGKPWKVSEITKRKETILKGLSQAGIHVSEQVVSGYFDSLQDIAERLERAEKKSAKSDRTPPAYFDWLLNMPQVAKIERVIKRIEVYNQQRATLLRRIEDFISTVNSFLCDTRKTIGFDTSNEIVVKIDEEHKIAAENLSSGEAQLVILFAYLYFGFQPTRKFVVMIDEPELSLHLGWQHRYVESVLAANPDAQFIFATHAPEIAQGHDNRCIELSPAGAAKVAEI